MIELHEELPTGECLNTDKKEKENYILTELATTFSDDVDFLRKVNKLTFGLTSKQ